MLRLESLIWIAGLLHFGVLIASALVPGVLNWRTELARLSTLTRQLIWVHGAFVVLVIIGFGTLTLINAAALVSGSTLARCLCGFICLFWVLRLSLQLFLFDPRPFLSNALLRAGHHGLTALFVYFSLVYGWAMLWPGHETLSIWRTATP